MFNFRSQPEQSSFRPKFLVVGILLSSLCAYLAQSNVGYQAETYASSYFGFNKHWLSSHNAALDPRLRVIVFDEKSVRGLGKTYLDLEEWGNLLAGLSKSRPKAILIDEIFASPHGMANHKLFSEQMLQVRVPVAVGAKIYRSVTSTTNSSDTTDRVLGVQLRGLLEKAESDDSKKTGEIDWLSGDQLHFEGAHPQLARHFRSVGHLNVSSVSRFSPLIRSNQEFVIPHLGLFAADTIRVNKHGLRVNGSLIALDSRGQALPFLLDDRNLFSNAISMIDAVKATTASKSIDGIKSGDIVLVLSTMPSVAKDFENFSAPVETNRRFTAAIVNSVLTGEWIRFYGWDTLVSFFAGIIGLMLAMTFGTKAAFLITLAVSISWVSAGFFLFTYAGLMVPWFIPIISLIATFSLVYRAKRSESDAKNTVISGALAGRMSPERIQFVLKRPELLESEAEGKIFTIMFIDIEGFSQISERLTPQQAFVDLKDLFDLMRWHVLRHGGVIDKVMGDGMLCFFGYSPDLPSNGRDHAYDAVTCAIEIQRAVLARNITASSTLKAIYPLRIGINTSSVFFGNIAGDGYFDFTLIGNGVNLAKRFEAACQHYRVMIGSATYDLLAGANEIPAAFTKKLIPIKHADVPFEAYEADPFYEQQKVINEITAAYRLSLGITRKDPRWPVPKDVEIVFESSFGSAYLNDFSISGISIVLPKYIGNGVSMDLEFMVPGGMPVPSLGTRLSLHVEVRWGRAVRDGYLHGVQIKNLSAIQKEDLIYVFRELVRGDKKAVRNAS